MKRVIFSHGDKGGVGKSTAAAMMVDIAVNRFGRCHVIDGDNKTPDLMNRFDGHPKVSIMHMQINKAGAASIAAEELSGIIERASETIIVVNLPSNAGDTLDELGPLLNDVLADVNADALCSYCLDKIEESATELKKSLGNGFFSAFVAEQRMLIFPAFKGKPEDFVWSTMSEADNYQGFQGVFPKLEPEKVFMDVAARRGLYSDIAQIRGGDITAYHRVAIREWIKKSTELLTPWMFAGMQTEEQGGA